MKTINKDVYQLIKKEENSFYDILLCNVCSQTCMRCNFSRHKKSPKHLRSLAIPILNQNTSLLLECDMEETISGKV